MKTLKIAEINQLVTDSDSADKSLQSEQRSNILLNASEHYARRTQQDFLSRNRDSGTGTKDQKLRLTHNHIQRIMKTYVNTVVSFAPDVEATPDNERDLSHVKASELTNSVKEYLNKEYNLTAFKRNLASDFFILGEAAVCMKWNPNKGKFLGFAPEVDEETGLDAVDDWGRPIPSDKPVFSGRLDLHRIMGYNLIRPKHCMDLQEAEFLGYKYMVSTKDLEKEYADDGDKLKHIKGASTEQFVVFDPGNGSYSTSKDQIQMREIYWRPCMQYPMGYFCIATTSGILEEGELPFGIFPIEIEPCEEFQGSCRGRSPIKHARPFQAEINRVNSKMAEFQVTLGDDKLVLTNGSKISSGAQLPGIRTVYTTGQAPTVIPGRTGEQYLAYETKKVTDLYTIMMVAELLEEKSDAQADPYTQIFKSLRQKKNFGLYAERYESLMTRFYTKFIDLYRNYCSEQELIPVIGKNEIVNISEFKNQKPLGFQITIKPMSEDIDSMMGKQMVLNHILQYAGPTMSPAQLGRLISEMPLLPEGKQIFSDLMIDEENAQNDILALDRGEMPMSMPPSNKQYLIDRLTNRQKQADFKFLDPQAQQNYAVYVQNLSNMIAQELQQTKALEADFIPANGFLTPCDFYVPDPMTGKPGRAKLPIDALGWLVQRLEAQGNTLERMQTMQQSNQGQIANMYQTAQGAQAQGQVTPDQQQSIQGGNQDGSYQQGPGVY